MRFVELEHARAASGVRLVVLTSVPSPWSESAKGIFAVKGIDALLVRLTPNDEAVRAWTKCHNAPVLMLDDEPPRTHWSEILEAAERLGGRLSLVPADPDERVRMFGLAHELLGDGGLVWSGRLIAIHRGLATDGIEGFPPPIGRRLGAKYGYAPERVEAAAARVPSTLRRFAALLEASRARGSEYLIGSALSALDIYCATALAPFALLPEEQCPGVHPVVRRAFETALQGGQVAVPTALLEHREMVYRRHLGLPVEL